MRTRDSVEWVQCGREFTAQEIAEIRNTVAWLPGLARKELAATVCEHLHWHTVAGTPKIQACQKLLERLEAAGLVELPALRSEQIAEEQNRSGLAQGVPGALTNQPPAAATARIQKAGQRANQ